MKIRVLGECFIGRVSGFISTGVTQMRKKKEAPVSAGEI